MPLYIEIDNPELALRKAMESGDSDLSTYVFILLLGEIDLFK